MTKATNFVLFEPWHLGDALIAYAVAAQDPDRLSLACHPRWHTIIRALSEGMEMPQLLSVDLPYINKQKPKPWQLGELPVIPVRSEVASIRGDIRDYFAARRIFPCSKLIFSGWTAFFARRSSLLNIPFAHGWLPVRNRYRAWASIAKVPWERVDSFYRIREEENKDFPIVIHVGAQWRARQFPHISELAAALSEYAHVKIVAGQRDSLPEGIEEADVLRVVDRELVDTFRDSSYVICNDSGPMHLAALLRRRTIVISRLSAIAEWIPPAVVAVQSLQAPKGYMPDPGYHSEEVIAGWPTISEVVRSLQTGFPAIVPAVHDAWR